MNIEEIRDAALNGRTFRFTGKINSLAFEKGTLNIDWVFPDAGKPFSPSVDLSYIELAPKYDPCRKFKKGDIVKPCSVNGRWCSHVWEDRSGIHYEVAKDEDPLTAHMEVKDPDSPQPFLVHAAFFKLVTPVEELEPYMVVLNTHGYHVEGCDGKVLATYYIIIHPNAYEAAKAECKRLNDEWRKERQK